MRCDLEKGKSISHHLLYRGDVVSKDVTAALTAIKARQTVQFVDWSSTGFKVGVCDEPPGYFPGGDLAKVSKSVCLLSNTTAIGAAWGALNHKFDLLFSKHAFIHRYAREGMEQVSIHEGV